MGIDLSHFDLQYFIIIMAVLIIAITIHEFAHAISADRLGDNTPRRQGRISLLPPDHLDPIGTLFMAVSAIVGFGIGWGKPVLTNPGNFKHPRRDQAIVAIAGPISNILQALVFAGIIYLTGMGWRELGGSPVGKFLLLGVQINFGLAFFNMIPIAPLDGHWILTAILPHEQAMAYKDWMNRYGPLLFLGLIFLAPRVISAVIGPPIVYFTELLLRGVPI